MVTAIVRFTLPSRIDRTEAAEQTYNAEWRAMIAQRYGAEPSVTYFETPVVVDNVLGEIVSEA